MSDTSSFDSLNSDNEFYKCINTLEKEVTEKYNLLAEKKYFDNYDTDTIQHGGNGDHENIKNIEDNKNIEDKKNIEGRKNIDDLDSKIDSLRDMKVGQINHKGQIINVYIDRNKKKYVNYKGKRVYT